MGTPCKLWEGSLNYAGYGRYRSGPHRDKLAHRVAWEVEHGPIPLGQVVCHSCDNPACVEPTHLFLGTQQDNLTDMTAKGRRAVGEALNHNLVTAEDARAIRNLYVAGFTQQEVADIYGICRAAVGAITTGRNWKQAGGPLVLGQQGRGVKR